MRITDIESFTVAVPFYAPLISAFGISYPARVRTLVRLHTDVGITGLGETGPSPLVYFNRDSLLEQFQGAVKSAVIGESPYDINRIRRKLFHSPAAVAIEIACWDIMAKAAALPLYRFIGGNGFCEQVPVAGYCFFRAPGPDGQGEVTLENFVEHCLALKERGGFKVLKAKLGAHQPEEEIPLIERLHEAVGDSTALRVDPNGSWSLATALRMIKRLEPLNLQYVEEPIRSSGPADGSTSITGLQRLRAVSFTPIAADHCYRLDLLADILWNDAADLVLADVFGSGGIAETVQFCQLASAFGVGVALHSGAELCIGQVAKLHIQAAFPDKIAYAGDAIYPEYVGGVLEGDILRITDGMMQVPQGPGLGVELDEQKLLKWELTDERHREFDSFWEQTKASIGVDYPGADFLMRHY